ncbi:Hsp20/alpha crystallin family protein [Trujillonella humicola]|uniref:Hsp20/alpha crystallin family protein n=1 Tax=Trujillonella humicola TaxID=3383699 RepID=UPI003906859A
MTALQERDRRTLESPWSRLDRLFDEWMRTVPVRRILGEAPGEDVIRVDEYRDDGTQVIRAELPGIDPDKDVEITLTDGMLRIDAERRVEEDVEKKGFTRHEMRYGSFTRTLPLAQGATPDDIRADYRDGVLEIRVPVAPPAGEGEPRRIPVSKA